MADNTSGTDAPDDTAVNSEQSDQSDGSDGFLTEEQYDRMMSKWMEEAGEIEVDDTITLEQHERLCREPEPSELQRLLASAISPAAGDDLTPQGWTAYLERTAAALQHLRGQ